MDMICPVPDVGREATERGCYRSYEVITAVFRSSQMILEYSLSRGGRDLYEKFVIVETYTFIESNCSSCGFMLIEWRSECSSKASLWNRSVICVQIDFIQSGHAEFENSIRFF